MPGVICNTSPIQYLYQADVLELLPALAGQVYVPEAVVAELQEGQRRNVLLPALEDLSWLIVRPVRDRTLLPLVTHLGDGEKEVLALGLETQDPLLLLDDRDARRYAPDIGVGDIWHPRPLIAGERARHSRRGSTRFRSSSSTAVPSER